MHPSQVCVSEQPCPQHPFSLPGSSPMLLPSAPRPSPEESAPGEIQGSDWQPASSQPPNTGHPHWASLSVSMARPSQLPFLSLLYFKPMPHFHSLVSFTNSWQVRVLQLKVQRVGLETVQTVRFNLARLFQACDFSLGRLVFKRKVM